MSKFTVLSLQSKLGMALWDSWAALESKLGYDLTREEQGRVAI